MFVVCAASHGISPGCSHIVPIFARDACSAVVVSEDAVTVGPTVSLWVPFGRLSPVDATMIIAARFKTGLADDVE